MNTGNGFYVDLHIPANKSFTGKKEILGMGLMNNAADEDSWTFPDEYTLMTPSQIVYADKYAFMSYMLDDEENTYYDSSMKLQLANKIKIIEVTADRIKGSFTGELILPSGREAIEVWGTFDARLND